MSMREPIETFTTPKEIAARLGINYRHFLAKLRRGEGPKFKRYGPRFLIRLDWYKAWIESEDK
jgi:hypothetical protein